ncbi:hypothetical protein EH31_03580 [Erythrobacter longus]|uniref:Uncharacterized protein n=2 Tax=Erythrobacter longus TaxID=1044 RepID=A0A074ME50_ERYLO|nr:hypothetical protein EH31_03580 [Erythrobacter longus]
MPQTSDRAQNFSPVLAQAREQLPTSKGFPRKLQAQFLRVLAQWGNVREAARAVGVSRSAAYRMRRECLLFSELWDAALLCARPQVEEVLADRALNGTQETVFYHGEEVATRTRYDSRLLLAHLGRLDRLEQDRRVVEATYGFDQQLEVLGDAPERGEWAPERGELATE